jgi:putative ABC transport system permease protein
LFLGKSQGQISCRIQTDQLPETLAAIESQWKAFAPAQPFSYSFLDQRFGEMYGNERRQGSIFAAFAFLAIFVACLGLLGLASFTAERRAKEIGIRKVLGATVGNIILMLSRDFALLVGISFVIASVVGWIAMRSWLSDFVYRINLGPGIFVGAGALAMAVALLTVSYQSVRAALADPIHSLRDE